MRYKKRLCWLLAALLLTALLAGCRSEEKTESQNPTIDVSAMTQEQENLDPAFLTGLEKGPEYPGEKRITAVMINNIARSRPTRGLTDAQVVYEIQVEGGITRFMALYEDYEKMPAVGGVRSARDQFLQLLLPFWGFLVHDGPSGSHPVNWMIRDFDFGEFSLQPNSGATFRMDRPGMPVEFTLYTDGQHITDAIARTGADDFRVYNSPMFNFVPYTQPPVVPAAGAAPEVAVLHSDSYRTLFDYDAQSARYQMSQFYSNTGDIRPTVDENNNQQVAFENVLVLFAPMSLYDNSPLVKVDYKNGGGGYYFSQGHYQPVVWRKGAPFMPLLLSSADKNETPVFINTGKTYVAVVDQKYMDAFSAHVKAGKGNEDLAQGQVNQNEADAPD